MRPDAADATTAAARRRIRLPPWATSPEAIVDLLGALAYAELAGFDQLSAEARLAPTLAGRADMSAMATVEFGRYLAFTDRLRELGAEPDRAMGPFVAALENYHRLTRPSTWLESLVKAYIGGGMADDFYREVAQFVDDEPTRDLIENSLTDVGEGSFAVREVRAALAAEPNQTGRLALWGRRLVGEAISQAQHVIAERDALTRMLVEGSGDLSGVALLTDRVSKRHEQRMADLGL